MAHPLDGARAKLHRANEHLDSLDAEVRGILQLDPNARAVHVRKEAKGYVVFCDPLPHDAPLRLSAICGDAVHNLHSALDYIVTGVLAASHKQPTRSNYFPIFSKQDDWLRLVVDPDDPKRSPLYGLDPQGEPWAVIEKAQPYHRGKDAWRHHLALLKILDNRDKHTALNVHMAFTSRDHVSGVVEWSDTVELIDQRYFHGPLSAEKRTDLMQLTFAPDGVDPEVRVKGALGIHPTFGDQTTQVSVGTLRSILRAVSATVENVSRLVAHDAPPAEREANGGSRSPPPSNSES